MKKILAIFLLSAFSAATVVNAQDKILKKVLELNIIGTGGQNGAAVAWHPKQKKYYAAVAGNTSFPLAVFDEKGKLLSDGELSTMFDIRGLWYNIKSGDLQMNGYYESGWATYVLDSKGIPTDIEIAIDEMAQPEENSVGSYSSTENLVYFLDSYGGVSKYDPAGVFKSDFSLKLGAGAGDASEDHDNSEISEDYNLSYAAVPKAGEIAILNEALRQIEVYSTESGKMKHKLKLPANAPVSNWMNFSYTNSMYWLFDKEDRKWIGYK
jgi:hypothetical protein